MFDELTEKKMNKCNDESYKQESSVNLTGNQTNKSQVMTVKTALTVIGT